LLCLFQVHEHTNILKTDGPDVIRMLAHPSQAQKMSKMPNEVTSGRVFVCPMNLVDLTRSDMASYVPERLAELGDENFIEMTESLMAGLVMGTYGSEFKPDLRYIGVTAMHPVIESQAHFCFGSLVPHPTLMILNYMYDIRRFYTKGESTLLADFNLSQPEHLYRVFRSGKVDKPALRSVMAYNAWAPNVFGETKREDLKDKPFAFLHREFFDRRDELEHKIDPIKADYEARYATTVRFMEYLDAMWMNGLGLKKFDPAFFNNDEVAQIYLKAIE
jgi:hypothetical protein